MSAVTPEQHQQNKTPENTLGISGFEFVEFAAQDAEQLHQLFTKMGFTKVAQHRQLAISLYRQGGINFIVNEQPSAFTAEFTQQHGPCVTGFAVRVSNASTAYSHMLEQGAKVHESPVDSPVDFPMVEGIGGSRLYLCDHNGGDVFANSFDYLEGVDPNPAGFGLTFIDHLTHNVIDGNMDQWADFYARMFNFFEVKYFDIKGQQTGLRSRAMTAADGCISIPINESSDPKSQINEYINEYNGEGVQHIALYTDDIYSTIEAMHQQKVSFLNTPDTYYEAVDYRIPEHGEDIDRMRKNHILIDAEVNDQSKQLLQIFTETNIGPVFFEVIQRKGNEGFGEGNFQALFEAIERDQQKRGVL